VILAEPGAGKTSLLSNMAEMYSVFRHRANVFRRKPITTTQQILIIDGIDEVAKIDRSAIEDVFAKASESTPDKIIFASRSSEWDEKRYNGLIRDFTGMKPMVLRLLPFGLKEQHQLFNSLYPTEKFNDFQQQATKFELDSLLENPLFLELIAKAYFKNSKVFSSKESMFSDAVICMAEESNEELPKHQRPSN
jgi:hypothetical protein